VTILSVAKYFGAHLFLAAYLTLAIQRLFALAARAASRRAARAPTQVRVAVSINATSSQARVEEDFARFDEALDEYLAQRAVTVMPSDGNGSTLPSP
jgi:uncharacterized membrane protein